MALITNEDIYVNKGDTFSAVVALTQDGTAVPFSAGDKVYFSMKTLKTDDEYVIQKIVTTFNVDNNAEITLTPTDTKALTLKTYYYDIQWSKATGEVYTVIKGKVIVDLDDITGEGAV